MTSLSAANRASTDSGSGEDALTSAALLGLPDPLEEANSEGLPRWDEGLELCEALF